MPLNLLPKKSWNVYNPTNIDKVRRDEALAAAAEAAEDERLQDLDAARRLAILRGESPPPLPLPPLTLEAPEGEGGVRRERERVAERKDGARDSGRERDRKKRKRPGEDDTDFEMRVARQHHSHHHSRQNEETESTPPSPTSTFKLRHDSNAPLTDSKGNISLFPISKDGGRRQRGDGRSEKEPETAEAVAKRKDAEDVARRKRDYERDYTVKFADAAGFGGVLLGKGRWFEDLAGGGFDGRGAEERKGKGNDDNDNDDAGRGEKGSGKWGNGDQRKQERESRRLEASDPLAMMRSGTARLREVERERRKWVEERRGEVGRERERERSRERGREKGRERSRERSREREKETKSEKRRKRHRERKEQHDDELEGFTLDGEVGKEESRDGRRRGHGHHRSNHHSHSQR